MKNKYYLLLLLFNAFCFNANAQNFEWLKTIGTNNSTIAISGIVPEKNGGSTVLLRTANSSGSNASVKIGNITYNLPSGNDSRLSILIRLDSSGKVLKSKKLGALYIGVRRNLCKDEFGNYYISGTIYNNDSVIVDNQIIYRKNGALVFAKLDSAFSLIWFKNVGNSLGGNTWDFSFQNGHLLFINSSKGACKYGASVFNFDPNFETYVYGEVDINNGNILWSKYILSNNSTTALQIYSLAVCQNKLFIVCNNRGSIGIRIGSDSILKNSSFILKTDSVGNKISILKLKAKGNSEMLTIVSDGLNLYVGGQFSDSVN